MQIHITNLEYFHWEKAREIYIEAINTGNATFEAVCPSAGEFDKKLLKRPRLAAIADGELAGWAGLKPSSPRYVYRGVAEESIYIGEKFRGKGIGKALLAKLIQESESCGIWTLFAGIFPENEASIKIHKDRGFRILGVQEKVGQMQGGEMKGRWRDVVIMERRSKKIF
jgi:phosphinothricin acetyltransferase